MRIRLGYVASPIIINESYSKTMTYKKYQELGEKRGNERIHEIIAGNIEGLKKVILYNKQNEISYYRLSHHIIPFSTFDKVHFSYKKKYKEDLKKVGELFKKNNVRIEMHTDPFCVINSVSDHIVSKSIDMLKYHNYLYSSFEYDGDIIMHIGSAFPTKEEAINRFIKNFKLIPKSIQEKIILENDDTTYTVEDILSVCKILHIRMVLDYHHFLCMKENHIENYLKDILNTWETNPTIHFSSPKSKREFKAHHMYIDYKQFIKFIDILKGYDRDVDIMLECKGKDEALFRLIKQLKFYTNYKFISETTFEI